MLSHFYLSDFAPYVAAWYVPSCTILGVFVFAQVLQDGLDAARWLKDKGYKILGSWRRAFGLAFGAWPPWSLSATLLLLLCSAYQMRVQQREIEEGNRKQIGLWLRQHAAAPTDTVFLEPLGYIGYYSQLKMLDIPGLSAPEVMAAERKLKSVAPADLIPELRPDWLVLRPGNPVEFKRKRPGCSRKAIHS